MNNCISPNEYYENYVSDKTHALTVQKYSIEIFEALKNLFNYNDNEKKLLEIGSLLHDIGYFKDSKSHNKAGRDFILENGISDLKDNEINIVANIIRYHRGKLPSDNHFHFIKLSNEDKLKTLFLAGICRLADGFDTKHKNNIEKINIEIGENIVNIFVITKNNEKRKFHSAKEKKDLLEKAIGKKIIIKQI